MGKFFFNNNSGLLFALFLMIEVLSCSSANPPSSEDSDFSDDSSKLPNYEVWINGIKDSVFVARVQDPPFTKEKIGLDFGGNYYFSSFDIDKPIEIKIKSKKDFNNVVFRPYGVEVTDLKKSNHELSFMISKPTKIIIEPAGKNSPLFLFANSVDTLVPDLNDPNLIFYGPGVYHPQDAIINLTDNQTLYISDGAIIHAGINVKGNNITICGRGIISGDEFVWGKFARSLISVEESSNVVVKDIILRGSATWTTRIDHSNHITIDNVKVLGGRAQNDDGINPCNSQDVLIKNCLIRTDDDCIALKGLMRGSSNDNVERITVENMILWGDRARIFLLGHESRAEYMRDLIFKNIDIVHFSMTPFLLEPGENMKLQNVLFENFRINGERQNELIRLKPTINQYMETQVPGYIKNVTFKDIHVMGYGGQYKIQIMGADNEHDVEDVNLINVSILDQKVTNAYENLEIGNYVSGISIQ